MDETMLRAYSEVDHLIKLELAGTFKVLGMWIQPDKRRIDVHLYQTGVDEFGEVGVSSRVDALARLLRAHEGFRVKYDPSDGTIGATLDYLGVEVTVKLGTLGGGGNA